MTEDDVAQVLEEIERADRRRTFDDGDVRFWHGVAVHAGWDLPGALRAVTAHYAENATWIMPADVTRYLRDRRDTNPWVGVRWV